MNYSFLKPDKGVRKVVDEMALKEAIANAEKKTSGEIKLFIEKRNPLMDVVERASDIFHTLQMQKTEYRNAVLIYLAYKDHEFALFGDKGIFEKYSQNQWQDLCDKTDEILASGQLNHGLEFAIDHVGKWLSVQFPPREGEGHNELPDEIVFGS